MGVAIHMDLVAQRYLYMHRLGGFVDFFDKLTTPRLYSKRVISAEDALSYIERESRLMFNPELVDSSQKILMGALR